MTSRTFAYCRVSTAEQTTENQILAIEAAGITIKPARIISETISGAVSASERPGFQKLLERMEEGDTLVVLKMDRLGRDSIDIQQTIERLAAAGISVNSLDLPGVDLTSTAGALTMKVLAAVADMERSRIKERTMEGLARAIASGVKLGRPVADDVTGAVQELRERGHSQSEVATMLGLSVRTVKRHCAKLAGDA